jgi:adiponectin receptor
MVDEITHVGGADADEDSATEDLWHTLITWDDLPKWLQDNSHIHTGYRKASNSYSKSLQSILHFHNESINIWTHLIPAILSLPFAYWLYTTLQPRYQKASFADVIVFACFFLGLAFCLGMSASFHTLSNHSPNVAKFWNQLDYAGIALLITGSFVPAVYYGFWCDPARQAVYWTMVSDDCAYRYVTDEFQICSLGVVCTTMSVLQRFRTPAWRTYRAVMFICMGLSAVFPVLDGLRLFGVDALERQMGLSWVVLQGALYIFGASLYAVHLTHALFFSVMLKLSQMRIPEAWYPGRFDRLGSSHQIFHVLIVLAAISHLKGLLKAFDYRHGLMGSVCI